MPTVTHQHPYDGAEPRIERLGLVPLWNELIEILTGFELRILEARDANGGAGVRQTIDDRFKAAQGWEQRVTGGVDWTKCSVVDGARVCLGVEIQFSGRSDMLIIDVTHLRDAIVEGDIDVGVIVVPADQTAYYLTDRVARFSDAEQAVERARAQDQPLFVLGLAHDGPGEALPKRARSTPPPGAPNPPRR